MHSTSDMRIAICTDQYLPLLSGVADSIYNLKTTLKAHGHEVRIYAPSMKDMLADPDVMRLPILEMPGTGGSMGLVLPRGAMRDIRAFKPDVIHTHMSGIAGLFAIYAAKRLKVPLVGTDHTLPAHYLHYLHLDIAPMRYLVRKLSAMYYQRCALISAPGHMALDELKEYGCTKPMRIISNEIQTELFRPLPDRHALKQKWNISKNAILLFGRLAKEKNVEVVLDILVKVAQTTGAQLVVVGDGPYRKEFEASVQARNLKVRVLMLGIRRGEELVEILNACDVFLITSESETQSMTTLQSMACGLPVVAVRAGALPEYVHDAVTGYVVTSGDISTFASRTIEILKDTDLAHKLGSAGRTVALQYSPERIIGLFEALYTDALNG